MIKKRVIPTLTYKDHGLVKSKKFSDYRMLGDPVQAIKIYNFRDVDEIFLVDISQNITRPNKKLIDNILQYAQMPITVGGGITTIEDIQLLLSVGADSVCISSSAFKDFDFIKEAVNKYGGQAIKISIDYLYENNETYLIFNPNFIKQKINILNYIEQISMLGISEIILTCVNNDGQMQGYDLKLISQIKEHNNVGIIINGGAGNYKHMLEAFNYHQVMGVCAASIFHFTEQTPNKARQFLKDHLIKVRS